MTLKERCAMGYIYRTVGKKRTFRSVCLRYGHVAIESLRRLDYIRFWGPDQQKIEMTEAGVAAVNVLISGKGEV